MRQVPFCYGVLGDGRVARHMVAYFKMLGLPFVQWTRGKSSTVLNGATHCLLLLSDDALPDFIRTFSFKSSQILIHFSGCLHLPGVIGAHPLMSFSHHLNTLSDYQKIPFIIDKNTRLFTNILPGLPNPHYSIKPNDKALYHALCVLANNGTTLLWQLFFEFVQAKFGLSKKDCEPLLTQTLAALNQSSDTALTGPWVRNDLQTIHKNHQALAAVGLDVIYSALFSAYQEIQHAPS